MSPTGGERSYYNCNGRRNGTCVSCDTPGIGSELLDAVVLQHMLDRVLIEENTDRIVAIVANSQTETTVEMEDELRNVSLEIDVLKEARKDLLKLVEEKKAVP